MSNITLYRGDSTKIKRFEFSRTKKYCYRGQGIYLTDDIKVAESYRTKGASYNSYDKRNGYLVNWKGPNRPDKNSIVEAAMLNWLIKEYREERAGDFNKLNDRQRKQYRAEKLPKWEDLIAEQRVKIVISDAGYTSSKERWHATVEFRASNKKPGRSTQFNFDKEEFENFVIHTDRCLREDKNHGVVLEHLYESKVSLIYINGEKMSLDFYREFYKDCSLAEIVVNNPYSHAHKPGPSFLGGNKEASLRELLNRSFARSILMNDKTALAKMVYHYADTLDTFSSDEKLALLDYQAWPFNNWSLERVREEVFDKLSTIPFEVKNPASFNSVIDDLEDLGYKGFEYNGGVNTGSKRHRAFVMWDEVYINDHITTTHT